MIVTYFTPDVKHPSSINEAKAKHIITISELAKILENKYKLLERFSDYLEERFIKYFIHDVLSENVIHVASIEGWVQNEWREWILAGGSKIITQAALDRGDISFIDTSAYYLSVKPVIKFNPEERKILEKIYKIEGSDIFKGIL